MMKNIAPYRRKDEVAQKLNQLYSDCNENGYDSGCPYQFFSKDLSSMLQFSSQWFTSTEPEKTNEQIIEYEDICENGIEKKFAVIKPKEEPPNIKSKEKDLNPLEKISYLEINGEKFRVVSATLEKCNSPAVKRTFNFTSRGIVETFRVPKYKKIQPIQFVPNPKFVVNRNLPVIRVNKPVFKAKENIVPKVTIFRQEQPKTFAVHNICGQQIQKRKFFILKKREPPKSVQVPPREIPKNIPDVIVLDDKSEKDHEMEVKEEPEENIPRCSSPSTDTGDEEILPENIVEENIVEEEEEKMVEPEKESFPKPFVCGESSEIFQKCEVQTETEKNTVDENEPLAKNTVELPRRTSREKKKYKEKSDSPVIMATSKFGRTRRVLNIAQLHKNFGVL